MHVALVKTSSMGDVIHTLPVVSDIRMAFPHAKVDWVVEEAFKDLPRLHPALNDVYCVAIRRWRKHWRATSDERGQVWRRLAQPVYTHVLDLQGLMKSAYVAWHLQGPRSGFAWNSAREPLASLSYQYRFEVSRDLHAIERTRKLAALALGYPVPAGRPVFGLQPQVGDSGLEALLDDSRPYMVFLHATARAEKLWPAACWQALLKTVLASGYRVVLPWGNAVEFSAARALAESIGESGADSPAVIVPQPMTLQQAAVVLANAVAVIGVDTGLTHLSAALDQNTICVFGATESWRYGPTWSDKAISLGGPGQWPQVPEVLAALDTLTVKL